MISVSSITTKLTLRAIVAVILIAALTVSTHGVSADSHTDAASERLRLTVAPESLPAEAGEHQILSVQLTGSTGVPILLSEPMNIRLFSSDPRVASVDSEFTIPAGSSFAIATVRISGEAGSVNFTASADNTEPGHATLEIAQASEASVGSTLTLFPMPDRLIMGSPDPGRAMVAVVDRSGSPVPMNFDVEVRLTSSDEKILSVTESVIIPAGAPGVYIDVTPGESGSGELIAVADGFSSSGIGIEVSEASANPTHLAAVVVPERWDHSGVGSPMLVVQAISKEEQLPGYLPCGIIFLASSNPDLLAVPGQVNVPCGKDIAAIEIPVVSTSGTGYALITVATPGLISASTEFNAVNRAPDELKSWVLPAKPAAGDQQPPVVIVQLVDHEGTPVAAPRPMPITVRTGDDTIVDVIQISTNKSYSAFPYTLITNSNDAADMWISAIGVSSVQLAWSNTETPVEAKIEFSEPWRYQSDPVIATISITLQGRPMQGALVEWEVEGGYVYAPFSTTDENGQAYAEVYSTALGQTHVTARIASDAIGEIEVMNHFDSVSLDQQIAPRAKLLGIPVDQFALLVVVAVIVIVLFDFARSGHLGSWRPGSLISTRKPGGPSPRKPSGSRAPKAQPTSNLLRVLAFRSGKDSFPLPNLPILDQLDADQLEFVRSEYAMRIESATDDGDPETIPVDQRDLIGGAAAVSALERLVERQTKDGEYQAAYKTAEITLNAASHLSNSRMKTGGDQLDRTRLWVLYSQTLLNADHLDKAMTAAQAAKKTADQIGTQAVWATTIGELENVIRSRFTGLQ